MAKEVNVKSNAKKEKVKEGEFKKFSVLKTIWNFVFWICFGIVLFVWVFDFFRVRNEEEPKFCVANKVLDYEDGSVKECVGLGYKVYNYSRKSINGAIEFGPFWMNPREK